MTIYDLEARFEVDDVALNNGDVLDSPAEGVDTGSLTVVELSGTAIISDWAVVYTDPAATGQLGLIGNAITRSFGKTLHMMAIAPESVYGAVFQSAADLDAANRLYYILFSGATSRIKAGVGDTTQSISTTSWIDYTYYQCSIVLGGYDVNGIPYQPGDTQADFLYGAAYFVRHPGTLSTWQLLWKTHAGNDATLYPVNYTKGPTLSRLARMFVPTNGLTTVFPTVLLDTFTDGDGTQLAAHTPEDGGAWTEEAGDIEIDSNTIVPKSGSSRANQGSIDSGLTSYVVEADLTYDSSVNRYVGIVVRHQDSANYVLVRLLNNKLQIHRVVAGSFNTEQDIALSMTNGVTYRLSVFVTPNEVTASCAGSAAIYSGTAFNTETEVGIRFRTDASYLAGNIAVSYFGLFPMTEAAYDAALDAVDDAPVPVTVKQAALGYHQRPPAVYFNGRTYYTWISYNGGVQIAYYNHGTSTHSTPVEVDNLYDDYGTEGIDDHNAPSLLILPSGKLLVFYACHLESSTTSFKVIRSTNIEDISTWDAPIVLAHDAATYFNYPEPRQFSNGDIIVFYRRGNTATPAQWHYRISDDDGATWAAAVQLTDFAVNTYWAASLVSGMEVHLTGFKWTGPDRLDVYYFYTDDGGTTWRTIDGNAVSTFPVAEADVDTVFDSGAENCRALDIVLDGSDNPHIVFIHDDSGTYTYKYAYYNAGWQIETITTTTRLLYPSNFYPPGSTFADSDETTVYLSKEVSGVLELQEWVRSGTWGLSSSITDGSHYDSFRPQTVLNGVSEYELVWMRGVYEGDINDWKGYGRTGVVLGGVLPGPPIVSLVHTSNVTME